MSLKDRISRLALGINSTGIGFQSRTERKKGFLSAIDFDDTWSTGDLAAVDDVTDP